MCTFQNTNFSTLSVGFSSLLTFMDIIRLSFSAIQIYILDGLDKSYWPQTPVLKAWSSVFRGEDVGK